MNAFFLFTGSGSMVVLTKYDSVENSTLLHKLASKGISKFIAFQIPVEIARQRYAHHFDLVSEDASESDELRVLDFNGERAFRMFSFKDMEKPIMHE